MAAITGIDAISPTAKLFCAAARFLLGTINRDDVEIACEQKIFMRFIFVTMVPGIVGRDCSGYTILPN